MNSAWHKSHPMPRPATTAQRVAWHLAHQRQCACRELPASVQRLIDQPRVAAQSKASSGGRRSKPRAAAGR